MTPDRWAQVRSVLADVLQAPATQRDGMLERVSAGDPALAAEVRALLEADAAPGLLDAPAHLDADTLPLDLTASTVPLTGEPGTVGPYRLTRRLGKGGMGEVFLATDLRLEREVAIKVVSPRLASQPAFAQQLLREARAAAKLSHPNIATVFDVVEVGEQLYLVMAGSSSRPACPPDLRRIAASSGRPPLRLPRTTRAGATCSSTGTRVAISIERSTPSRE
jgi:hypothetical protein